MTSPSGVGAERSAADWAQFRGPGGAGTSAEAKLPLTWGKEKNLRWKVELPGPGTSSPIVVRERLYLTYQSGKPAGGGEGKGGKEGNGAKEETDGRLRRHLLCARLEDGQALWTRSVDADLPEQERIREDHGYASSTPVADAERVYVFFGRSGVLAFDHEGAPAWRAKVGDGLHGWGSAASPILHEGLVIVNAAVESQALVALERETGKERWRAPGIEESWNTPILARTKAGATELVVARLGKVLGFDPRTGERLWSCDTDISWYMCPSLVSDADIVYAVGGRQGGCLAVRTGGRGDVTPSHRLWRLSKGSNVPSPVYHEGRLYFLHENLGIAYCIDAATGEVLGEKRLEPSPGQFYPSPILAAGRLYCLARDGTMVVLSADPALQELARNDLRDRSPFNASPAVAGDRLLLRSDRALYCVGEGKGGDRDGGRGSPRSP